MIEILCGKPRAIKKGDIQRQMSIIRHRR